MIRAYRYLVTVYVEGDTAADLPAPEEIAEHIATQVQDADDHDLATCAHFIEQETYTGRRIPTKAAWR